MQNQTAPSTIGEALSDLRYDRDREFDQTAKTEPDRVCPVCRSAECPRPATSSLPAIIGTHAERRVSPSILEFRNQELAAENIDLKERLRVATERIAGFERISALLSQKLEEFDRDFKAITRPASDEAAITLEILPDCGRSVPTPNEYEISKCVFPAGHAGPCSKGV